MTPDAHRRTVEQWRAARDRRLRDPDGWLTLIGLHWLEPGTNRLGSSPENELVIRAADMPEHAGTLVLEDGAVRLERDGHEPELLRPDMSGEPTVLELGSLRLHVIQRGDRFGLRVRDHASPALERFTGMEAFPIDLSWRLEGRLEPAEPGVTLEIVDVTGTVSHEPTPGAVAFTAHGREWRLHALPGGDDGSLWLVFADATNGATTYGGGRFLYSDAVQTDGSVMIDFNLAYNPPCVFSPYATCPLPPAVNRLELAIEAGEQAYHPA